MRPVRSRRLTSSVRPLGLRDRLNMPEMKGMVLNMINRYSRHGILNFQATSIAGTRQNMTTNSFENNPVKKP